MAAAPSTRPALRSHDEAQRLVLDVLRTHADALLRTARRHSLCADDANDAYQRAVEIFLRHAATLEAADAHKWLAVVVKHEAMRVRAQRARTVGDEDVDLDGHAASRLPTPDEQAEAFDMLTRSAEALAQLKPQEVRALWLKAQGHTYEEIAELEGWTYTKVNRALTEGRRAFLRRFADIGSGEECRRWEPVLSALVDGEATPRQLAGVRPHLRHCPACRARVRALHEAQASVAALLPVPAAAAAAAPSGDGGLLARLYDLAGTLHERAVLSSVKLQHGVEVALPGKLAVAAATTAAAIGGGVAVERAVSTAPPPATRAAAVRSAPPPSAAVVAAVPDHDPPAATPAGTASRAAASSPRTVAQRTTKTEFGLSRRRARSASVRESTAAREFDTADPAPAAPAPAPVATAAAETAAPAPAPSRDAQTAAAEFGG